MTTHNLAFDETKHEYRIDGKLVPSITHLIDDAFHTYDHLKATVSGRAKLKKAADFGNNVHAMAELYINNDLDLDGLDPLLMPWLKGFQKYLDEQFISKGIPLSSLVCECPVGSARLMVAGKPDIVLPGSRIDDLKTRSYSTITDPLQLAGYEKLCGGRGNDWEHNVVELKPHDYSIIKCNNREAWLRMNCLIEHYWAEQEFQRKIKIWKGEK